VSASPLVLALWLFLLLFLFGLLRLQLARRGTDEDWQALVAFGKKHPPATPERWGELCAAAPPGLHLDDSHVPLSTNALDERMRAHQAVLQGEMKWFARRLTNPFHWLVAGVRGILLLSYGAPVDFDAATRARRRAIETHADFDRVVHGFVAVVLFAMLVTTWFAARAGLAAYLNELQRR
jgi:hypothetical protein